jgi:hypothetical protein
MYPFQSSAFLIQAVNKWSLFQSNPALTVFPTAVTLQFLFPSLGSFVLALPDHAFNLIDPSITELVTSSVSTNLQQSFLIQRKIHRTHKPVVGRQREKCNLTELFELIMNRTVPEGNLPESAALFLQSENNSPLNDAYEIFSYTTTKRSQELLISLLGNVNLEPLFLHCSKTDTRVSFSDLMNERRIDLEYAGLFSESTGQFAFERIGSAYSDFVRYLQIGFLNGDDFAFWKWRQNQFDHVLSNGSHIRPFRSTRR